MKLHIGGATPHPEWKIFDVEARPEVDFVGDAIDLSRFADDSIEAIYASHVLEHFHYLLDDELPRALAEWHRVLQPGGKLYLSVPDLPTLCALFVRPDLTLPDRYLVMRIIFGGQMNAHDVHRVGFDFEILSGFLRHAGFARVERVGDLGIFDDTSRMQLCGVPISLNAIAEKG